VSTPVETPPRCRTGIPRAHHLLASSHLLNHRLVQMIILSLASRVNSKKMNVTDLKIKKNRLLGLKSNEVWQPIRLKLTVILPLTHPA
jgi:hypothetical protein